MSNWHFRTFYSYSYFVPGILCLLNSFNKNLFLSKAEALQVRREEDGGGQEHISIGWAERWLESLSFPFKFLWLPPSMPLGLNLFRGQVCPVRGSLSTGGVL